MQLPARFQTQIEDEMQRLRLVTQAEDKMELSGNHRLLHESGHNIAWQTCLLYISPALPRRDGHGLARAVSSHRSPSHQYRASLLTHGTRRAERHGGVRCHVDVREHHRPAAAPVDRWRAPAARAPAFSSGSGTSRVVPPAIGLACALQGGSETAHWRVRARSVRSRSRASALHAAAASELPGLRASARVHGPRRYRVHHTRPDRQTGPAEWRSENRVRDAAGCRGVSGIERRELARFDRVFVCSEADRAHLLAGGGPRRVDCVA